MNGSITTYIDILFHNLPPLFGAHAIDNKTTESNISQCKLLLVNKNQQSSKSIFIGSPIHGGFLPSGNLQMHYMCWLSKVLTYNVSIKSLS